MSMCPLKDTTASLLMFLYQFPWEDVLNTSVYSESGISFCLHMSTPGPLQGPTIAKLMLR